MQFLGLCEVCGKENRNYRALSSHLRQRKDVSHRELKARWHRWRSEYKATLRCRKCGNLWETTDKKQAHKKRCPDCRAQRESLGKRRYERFRPEVVPDTRQMMTAVGNKASWDGLRERHVVWEVGDDIYRAVLERFQAGVKVGQVLREVGIPYDVYSGVLTVHLGGPQAYRAAHKKRKQVVGHRNIRKAHEKRAALSPEERAAWHKKHFGQGSALEAGFAEDLRKAGVADLTLNDWQSLRIGGRWCPREADIKVALGDGRKVVILCDGEAFHGPGFIYGPPADRIAEDVRTAEAYFATGYSVVRYSETEIQSGWALPHFQAMFDRLRTSSAQGYRTWHPSVERFT